MIKNTHLNVDLKTVMQQGAHLQEGLCYNGVLTRDGEDHYRFEEATRRGICKRNPKLFDGEYISLVHMRNGRYQCHMKTISASTVSDCYGLAYKVYSELVNALQIIDQW